MNLRPSHVLACGGLGRYDRGRVRAIAAALGGGLDTTHEDEASMLMLDRPPLRWQGGRARGLAWSERAEPVTERLGSWRDAATIGAACGLACEGRRRLVHSSVAGIGPIYFIESEGAIYFATRIDPLVTTSPGRLSVDWDAWASILTLDHALGDRTPFAEVRRLRPFSRLECRRGRARVNEERWAWAEVEPQLAVEDGADALLARMRAAVARLPAGPLICTLTGGWDSRIVLLLFAEERRDDVLAFTYGGGPRDRDRRFASMVAAAAAVPHEVVLGDDRGFWPNLERRLERVDYQQLFSPWAMALCDRLREVPGTVSDGFGLDHLAQPGKFVTAEAVAAGGSGEAVRVMWRRLMELPKQGGAAAFSRPFAQAITAATRRQFVAETTRFAGHPARAVLSNYWIRGVRAMSPRPAVVWGADLTVAAPFVDHGVVSELLAINPEAASGAKIYEALFARFDPAIAALPSTHDPKPSPTEEPPNRPSEDRSSAIALGYHERLPTGPLTPFLRARTHRQLARGAAGGFARTPAGARGPSVFHLWCERYRDRLGEVDPRAAFEVAPRPIKHPLR